MQVKIMMLLSDKKYQRLCRCAETVLQEVAGSFGHSFSIRYEKIGKESMLAYDAELTEEAVENCLQCDGILLDDANAGGVRELLDELGVHLTLNYYGASSAQESEVKSDLWSGIVRSLDTVTLRNAVSSAFEAADKLLCPISYVAPNGKNEADWHKEIKAQSMLHPACVVKGYSADQMMEKILLSPDELGLVLCPPYAGGIFRAALKVLSSDPFDMHAHMMGVEHSLFASSYQGIDGEKPLSPIAMVMALSAMLRFSAKLEKEADCVDAAVHNVLEAGWCTPDMPVCNEDMVITPEDLVDLICEQITLAGQLLGGSGGMNL